MYELRITIGGAPGSGKSAAAKLLSERSRIHYISAGDVFRTLAEERNMSLAEFGELAEEDLEFDRLIDEKQQELAEQYDDVIVDGRLSAHMITNADLRVWLTAPLEVRAERVAFRDEIEYDKAHSRIVAREACENKRYQEFYNIDMNDLSAYDLIINTSHWSAESIAEIIMRAADLLED